MGVSKKWLKSRLLRLFRNVCQSKNYVYEKKVIGIAIKIQIHSPFMGGTDCKSGCDVKSFAISQLFHRCVVSAAKLNLT